MVKIIKKIIQKFPVNCLTIKNYEKEATELALSAISINNSLLQKNNVITAKLSFFYSFTW